MQTIQSDRRGVTLIELLVVVSIIALLAVVAIPRLRPAAESRRTRETARMVNLYFSTARAKAKETGQPAGVLIDRWGIQPECSILLRQVEVPPLYSGDVVNATCRVQLLSLTATAVSVTVQFPPGVVDFTLIGVDDTIKFGYQGIVYRIAATDPAAERLTAEFNPSRGQQAPWLEAKPPETVPPWTGPMAFQITRQPAPSLTAPLQLPEGAVIDLYESGTNKVSFERLPAPFVGSEPIIVMFGPSGSVEEVRGANVSRTDTLFFLIGRADRVPRAAVAPGIARGPSQHDDGLRNYQDTANLWVSLNPQSGQTVTVENAAYTPPAGFDYTVFAQRLAALQGARRLAQTGQGMGGR